MKHTLKISLLFVAFFFSSSILQSQESAWRTLTRVQIKKQYDEEFGIETIIPTFTNEIRAMEGKEITVGGYIFPTADKRDQSHLMFSMYPISNCFFCGKAGPETAMQVFMADNKKVKYTEDKIFIKGKLQLSEHDPSGLIYTLINAQLIDQ